ncbi:MAG: hypothetical protein M1838_002998 [Thelocarpon superellum]|nr:MAG: hypothetical protein M1838_002998 [Thelocarpon superellum]
MAIHPRLNPHHATTVDHAAIEAWTEQAAEALQGVTISPPSLAHVNVRGTSVSLAIPLDDTTSRDAHDAPTRASAGARRRREPLCRDSLKRREALLKGKDGSRRRQRWENDRLLNNPYAQAPLPSDWEVHPTYPRHATVPYYLAPLWDGELGRKASELKERKHAKKDDEGMADVVLKELRGKLKKTRAARGLLQDLETEVRGFVERWEQRENRHDRQTDIGESEHEEIVFLGRNRAAADKMCARQQRDRLRAREAEEVELARDKLVFNSFVDDHGAGFGRWLVHSIGRYYGLRTWSVTVGDPARREAYVGIDDVHKNTGRRLSSTMGELPRPLWGLV